MNLFHWISNNKQHDLWKKIGHDCPVLLLVHLHEFIVSTSSDANLKMYVKKKYEKKFTSCCAELKAYRIHFCFWYEQLLKEFNLSIQAPPFVNNYSSITYLNDNERWPVNAVAIGKIRVLDRLYYDISHAAYCESILFFLNWNNKYGLEKSACNKNTTKRTRKTPMHHIYVPHT